MEESRYEKIFTILLIALLIFTIGVQVGIHHGRELQKQEFTEQLYD